MTNSFNLTFLSLEIFVSNFRYRIFCSIQIWGRIFFLHFFLKTCRKKNIQINVIAKIIQTFLALTKLMKMYNNKLETNDSPCTQKNIQNTNSIITFALVDLHIVTGLSCDQQHQTSWSSLTRGPSSNKPLWTQSCDLNLPPIM